MGNHHSRKLALKTLGRYGGRLALGASIAVAGLSGPSVAVAHAGLVKSVPGSRAQLRHPPPQVELCFNEAVELNFSTVQLWAPDGEQVPLEALQFGETGHKCVVAPVPPLEQSGTYTVKYKVLSQDGHVVEYGYTFGFHPSAE